MSQGNWDYLIEEQKKRDEVVDKKLKQEEEAVRRGQEVHHMHFMDLFIQTTSLCRPQLASSFRPPLY